MHETIRTFSVFADFERHVHTGSDLVEALEQGRREYGKPGVQTVVMFDDTTGERTEIDPRGGVEPPAAWMERAAPAKAGPGRPKLGVVSREVSLLPRHWDWLREQPGGASAALRRLVDEARKVNAQADGARQARDAVYKFMVVVGEGRSNFEEASRALYAGRLSQVAALTAGWPADLSRHIRMLLDRAQLSANR